jgi:hypothetical protein
MTNEEMAAKIEELTRDIAVLTQRVQRGNGVLLDFLSDREGKAMVKGVTMFKNPREKAVDIIGAMVRPWLMVALIEEAKAVRALPLDSVLSDITTMVGQENHSAEMAGMVRTHGITWDEIGVAPDGSVRPDSMAKLPKHMR